MTGQNGISVEDMLKLEVMGDSNLIAGSKGARNTITRVNIMADPDIIDWVSEGEFLLTTAYFFKKENAEVQKNLIEECSKKKLSGIGIKVHPYLDFLSQEVIDLADELGFPLIDIHYSIPLSDVMLSTIKAIFNKQASLLERIEKVHGRFINVMLNGNGIEELTKIVEENIKNPVILKLNFSHDTIEQLENVDDITRNQIREDVKRFYNPNSSKSKLKKLDEEKMLINGKYVKRMVMPIVVKDNVYGHIFSWSTNTPLGGFDLSIIESATTTIALAVLQELSIKEIEIRYRSEYFEDLISVDSKRKRKALERARFFNLNPSDYYVIEVMSFKFKFDKQENDEYSIDFIQDYINRTVTTVEEIIDYFKIEGIVASKMNGIQILLGFKDKKSIDDRLRRFNDMVVEKLGEKFKNLEVKIGVGRAYKGLINVSKSFADAIKTIRTGRILTERQVVYFDDLGIFKILCQDFLTEELEDFYATTLKPLVDYDNKKSTELVKTLEAYFMFNGNLTRMSEHLYTHYNTILYRINRINEITGMNLDDSNDRLNLEIALKIRELLVK